METNETKNNYRDGENPYDQAIASVRLAIAKFDGCTEEEKTSLTRELEQLRSMAEKLESGRVEIVVFGEISTGKSALINALVGKTVAETNIRGGWTQDVWKLDWSGAGYCIPGLASSEIVLVDTPGLNEVDGETRAAMAEEAAARADLVLFVTDSDLNETEFTALMQLAATSKPLLLVINKKDLYTREQLADLFTHFASEKYHPLIDPQHLVAVAADPNEKEYLLEAPDGTTRSQWRKPAPDIDALREKILEILDTEGKAIVALNAAIFAADTSDRMAALRVQLREGNANKVIWGYATAKAIAVAANPIPWADVLGGTTVDIAMVATLSKIYGFQLSKANAGALIASILKAAGWVTAAEWMTHLGAGLLNTLTGGLGKLATSLPQGAAAGYGSYIVGQASRYYFQHGASWGEASPKQIVAQILENTDKQSILLKLKEEIRKKLNLNPYAEE